MYSLIVPLIAHGRRLRRSSVVGGRRFAVVRGGGSFSVARAIYFACDTYCNKNLKNVYYFKREPTMVRISIRFRNVTLVAFSGFGLTTLLVSCSALSGQLGLYRALALCRDVKSKSAVGRAAARKSHNPQHHDSIFHRRCGAVGKLDIIATSCKFCMGILQNSLGADVAYCATRASHYCRSFI
jgi:hypothetical protein